MIFVVITAVMFGICLGFLFLKLQRGEDITIAVYSSLINLFLTYSQYKDFMKQIEYIAEVPK